MGFNVMPGRSGPVCASYDPSKAKKNLGKIWERTQDLKTPAKSHRINGPCVFVCSHNPKVVSSNLTPATTRAKLNAWALLL